MTLKLHFKMDGPTAEVPTRNVEQGLKILFLADRAWPDAAGGAQTVAWELAKGLVGRGHHVTFLTPSPKTGFVESEEIAEVRVIRHHGAGSLSGMLLGGRRVAGRLAADARPHLIHSHFAYAELGPRLGLPEGIPWVRSFYGPWDEEGWVEDTGGSPQLHLKARVKKWIRRRIELSSLKRARRVVVLSEFSHRQAVSLGDNSTQLRLIPGGSDLRRFHPHGTREEARARLGWSAVGPLLVTVRRLVPRMGLEALVRAMPQVLQQEPGAKLVIGGRGPEHGRLESLIKELALGESVTLAGFIPDGQLADCYRAADLFVLPTLSLEGFGLVTVDALACGTPVLGTPSGATPEILGPLDSRLLAAGTSSKDLADGILNFWKGNWRRGLTAERLHQYVRERYTWDRHLEGMLGVYEEALRTPQ